MVTKEPNQVSKINSSGEISFIDLVIGIRNAIRYIRRKWIIVLLGGVIGGIGGLAYAIFTKTTYTAVCTFVLEDSKSGGMSQYAGLASLAGVNIGGGSGGSIFEGDNILELYKSRSMLEKTLLSEFNFNGKKQLLINRFIDFNDLKHKYLKYQPQAELKFTGDPEKFSTLQDSVITDLVDLFNKKVLSVSKPDKKLSIIKVEVVTKDELFSKCFTEKLVQTVNDFYIQTKTKKTFQNIQILQRQADSVRSMLNSSISGVASAIDAAPNANPLMSTLRVSSQRKQIDVQANTAIYGEIVKNLELEKVNYRQDMPLIQVVDKPVLPLLQSKNIKYQQSLKVQQSMKQKLMVNICLKKKSE